MGAAGHARSGSLSVPTPLISVTVILRRVTDPEATRSVQSRRSPWSERSVAGCAAAGVLEVKVGGGLVCGFGRLDVGCQREGRDSELRDV